MAEKTTTIRVVGRDEASRTFETVSRNSAKAAGEMEGHAARVGKAFSGLDNLLGQFGVPFTGALSAIGSKLDDFQVKSTSTFKKVSDIGGLTLAAVGAAAVGVGIESVHLADQFESAHARVETAVKNTGVAYDDWSGKVQAADKHLEDLGFTNTEAEGSMSGLINATHDTGKALDLMSLAADIARGRHISLEQATGILTKVETGHVSLLGRLGINTKDATGATIDQQTAIERLTAMYQGQASAYTDTFVGKQKVLSAQLQDLGVKIGEFLIPIIEKLIGAISDTIDWFERHKEVAIAVAGVITTVLGAAIAVFVYDKVSAFVEGIQRMLTGLGLLGPASAEAAAEVEASSATMAASGEAGAAGLATEGEAAGGLALGPFALLIGAAAGVAYGISKIVESGDTAKITFNGLATNDVPKLTESLDKNKATLDKLNGALDGYGIHVSNAAVNHREFNDILDKTPAEAQTFIDAVQKAGGSTDWYTQQLQSHEAQTLLNQNAADQYQAKLGLLKAQTDGDAGAAQNYTAQLFYLQLQADKFHDIQFGIGISGIGDAIAGVDNLSGALGAAATAASRIHIPGFSKGGFVPGSGDQDSIPAMLTPGEFVVSKDMQKRGNWGPLGVAGHHAASAPVGGDGGHSDGRPVIVQLVLDGKVIHESLLKRKRQTGDLRLV